MKIRFLEEGVSHVLPNGNGQEAHALDRSSALYA